MIDVVFRSPPISLHGPTDYASSSGGLAIGGTYKVLDGRIVPRGTCAGALMACRDWSFRCESRSELWPKTEACAAAVANRFEISDGAPVETDGRGDRQGAWD